MSGIVDALLADLIEPSEHAWGAPTPANPANPTNSEHPCVAAPDSGAANVLRIPANPRQQAGASWPDSQTFAAIRNPNNCPDSEPRRGNSQNSQDSQGCLPTCTTPTSANLAVVAWTDADIAAFLDRRARLMRWRWSETDAEKLAERLVMRDREADERVSCTDCRHYRPSRCGNHRLAGLHGPEVGRDLAALLQRCPGFTLAPGLTRPDRPRGETCT